MSARILLLTQIVPYPLDSGPKIKTFNLLRHLAERHDVHLVSFVRSDAEREAADALRQWCRTVDLVPIHRSKLRDVVSLGRAILTGGSFLVQRDDSAQMRATVARLLTEHRFDAVHADQLTMGQFAVNLPLPLRVLDEHNAVWTIVKRAARAERWGPKRLVAELEWRRLKAYEGALCQAFDRLLVVSAEDRRDLEEAAGGPLPATVIPIAVDADALAFEPPARAARDILSMATMFYPPNVESVGWFAREVLPQIREGTPDSRFFVVGSRPPAEITTLQTPTSGIVVTGYVEDPTPYLRRSALLVVPLRAGSGMRVKILEAFARGIPVVSTTIGVEGIEARHGEHLLVADGPDAFARAVLDVLDDPEAAARRASAARALIVERYDRRAALHPLDDVYGEARTPTCHPFDKLSAGSERGEPAHPPCHPERSELASPHPPCHPERSELASGVEGSPGLTTRPGDPSTRLVPRLAQDDMVGSGSQARGVYPERSERAQDDMESEGLLRGAP